MAQPRATPHTHRSRRRELLTDRQRRVFVTVVGVGDVHVVAGEHVVADLHRVMGDDAAALADQHAVTDGDHRRVPDVVAGHDARRQRAVRTDDAPLAQLDVLLAVERSDGEADRGAVAEPPERPGSCAAGTDGRTVREPFPARARRRLRRRCGRCRGIGQPSNGLGAERVDARVLRRKTTAANSPPSTTTSTHSTRTGGQLASWLSMRTGTTSVTGGPGGASNIAVTVRCAGEGRRWRIGRGVDTDRRHGRATPPRGAPRRRRGRARARRVRPRPTIPPTSSRTRCSSPRRSS